MRKIALPFFSCLLVLTLLLGSFGSVKAAIGDDPIVTPVSGDMEFTSEIIPIASLPGITELAGGMLAPAGFPEGEAQFEGNGIRVTGMDSGKANACFAISGTQYGWGGKVALWTGAKWELLPTTITTPDETPNSTACATITSSGTYAFIKYVTDPTKLPKLGVCSSTPSITLLLLPGSEPDQIRLFAALVEKQPVAPEGSSVSYRVLSTDPAGILLQGHYNTGTVFMSDPNLGEFAVVFGSLDIVSIFDAGVVIEYNPFLLEEFTNAVVRIYFPDCYTDLNFPDDFEIMPLGLG
jgi:hypothetical protein